MWNAILGFAIAIGAIIITKLLDLFVENLREKWERKKIAKVLISEITVCITELTHDIKFLKIESDPIITFGIITIDPEKYQTDWFNLYLGKIHIFEQETITRIKRFYYIMERIKLIRDKIIPDIARGKYELSVDSAKNFLDWQIDSRKDAINLGKLTLKNLKEKYIK